MLLFMIDVVLNFITGIKKKAVKTKWLASPTAELFSQNVGLFS